MFRPVADSCGLGGMSSYFPSLVSQLGVQMGQWGRHTPELAAVDLIKGDYVFPFILFSKPLVLTW
jgi:hypothetical protein